METRERAFKILILLFITDLKKTKRLFLFIGLLTNYEKLVSAAQYLSPALADLEAHHLSQFSLTWKLVNQHLYQHIIYQEPLIQNNVPIFISQVCYSVGQI